LRKTKNIRWETALLNEDVYKVSVDVTTDKRTTEEKRLQRRTTTDTHGYGTVYVHVYVLGTIREMKGPSPMTTQGVHAIHHRVYLF
jgi:predicted metalloenzyme YecM